MLFTQCNHEEDTTPRPATIRIIPSHRFLEIVSCKSNFETRETKMNPKLKNGTALLTSTRCNTISQVNVPAAKSSMAQYVCL